MFVAAAMSHCDTKFLLASAKEIGRSHDASLAHDYYNAETKVVLYSQTESACLT